MGACSSVLGNTKAPANSRCNLALREARDFLLRLQRVEKDLKNLDRAALVALDTSSDILLSHLPRTAEELENGGANTPRQPIGGVEYSGDEVARLRHELEQRMLSEVFAPLQQWVANYNECSTNQRAVNKAYSEMESFREKTEKQERKLEKYRMRSQQDVKVAQKTQELAVTLQQKQASLAGGVANYQEMEAKQYAHLVTLIRDSAYLRAFIKTALSIEGSVLSSASHAMPAASATPLAVAQPVTVPTLPVVTASLAGQHKPAMPHAQQMPTGQLHAHVLPVEQAPAHQELVAGGMVERGMEPLQGERRLGQEHLVPSVPNVQPQVMQMQVEPQPLQAAVATGEGSPTLVVPAQGEVEENMGGGRYEEGTPVKVHRVETERLPAKPLPAMMEGETNEAPGTPHTTPVAGGNVKGSPPLSAA